MKIQLTIKTTYLPDWNQWHGIRELVQNGRDAEIQHRATFKVDWFNNTLRFENDGVTLPIKALLLGHTDKADNNETAGKFGEGLKLGILALVRAGHPVRIRNGSEVWVPTLEHSDVFDEEVLTFTIEKGRAEKERIRIEVGNVEKADWDVMRTNFLFIHKPKKNESIQTYSGTLLLAPRYQGKVYVKGIFVQSDPRLVFGYDLSDAELDRDRKMIESWNLKYKARTILMNAAGRDKKLLDRYADMLDDPNPGPETEGMESWNVSHDVASVLAAKFKANHGEDAIPVASLAESEDIEHLGRKGVIVPSPLSVVLGTVMGNVDKIKEGLQKETIKAYSWHELTDLEKSNLKEVVERVNAVEPLTLDMIDIADFRSEKLLGQFHSDGSGSVRMSIAHRLLANFDRTLEVAIHEIAHRNGKDGELDHVASMERIWRDVFSNLRTASRG
jgi:hypothetical protein